jgi:ubiquinone/menaquinone biosynthesis C-methylase UbiE
MPRKKTPEKTPKKELPEYLEKTISFYDGHVSEFIQKTRSLQDLDWLEKFVPRLPKGARVLDVGCAWGRDCLYFTERGFDTIGIDLSEKMLEVAAGHAPEAKYRAMDLSELDFPAAYFAGIWCSAALLHVPKKQAPNTLAGFAHVMSNQGLLYLKMKEGQFDGMETDDRYQDAQKYYAYYSQNELRKLIENAGFSIVEFGIEDSRAHPYKRSVYFTILARKK